MSSLVMRCNSSREPERKMLINLKKNCTGVCPVLINDQAVEMVQEYNYNDTVIEGTLSFDLHVNTV